MCLVNIFDQFDQDKNGVLNVEEFKAFLQSIGANFGDAEVGHTLSCPALLPPPPHFDQIVASNLWKPPLPPPAWDNEKGTKSWGS